MIKILAQKAGWVSGIELLISQRLGGDNKIQYALPENIHFTELQEGIEIEPSLRLGYTEAQILMDELWNCGLRPTEGSGSAGALLATQNHLKDLQKVLDKHLTLLHE